MNIWTTFFSFSFLVIFIIVVFALAKSENRKTNEIVSHLTNEQKKRLMNVQIHSVEGKPHCWIQEMLIVSTKEKGNKVGIKAIYYNLMITNDTYETFCLADFSASKGEFDAKKLSVGSFVSVYVDPEKSARLA